MKKKVHNDVVNGYQLILDRYESFSKSHKRVADYVVTHLQEVLYFPMAKLVDAVGVSHATVVRFAQGLGYEGFNELRDSLFAYYQEFLAPEGRMRHSIEELERGPLSYESITRQCIAFLERSIAGVDEKALQGAAAALCAATRVYVFGLGPDESLGLDLHFRLRRLKLDTVRVADAGRHLFEHLLRIQPSDVAVLYTFANPSADFRRLMRVLADRKVPSVLITDLQTPPVVRQASYLLQADRGPRGTFPSPLVPTAITYALTLSVADRLGAKALEALKELGDLRETYYVQDS
jgi:DNA-binding MurR/RpiR family transcriptional regulator